MHPCEFGIPTVYKPSETIRTLRRLFAGYNLLNRQIRMLKNTIQAMLAEDGVTVSSNDRSRLFKGREAVFEILSDHHLSEVHCRSAADSDRSAANDYRIEGSTWPENRGGECSAE
jgi:hypothetical protein